MQIDLGEYSSKEALRALKSSMSDQKAEYESYRDLSVCGIGNVLVLWVVYKFLQDPGLNEYDWISFSVFATIMTALITVCAVSLVSLWNTRVNEQLLQDEIDEIEQRLEASA